MPEVITKFTGGDYAVHRSQVVYILERTPHQEHDLKAEIVQLDESSKPLNPDDFTVISVDDDELYSIWEPLHFLIAAAHTLAYQRDRLKDELIAKNSQIDSLATAIHKLKSA